MLANYVCHAVKERSSQYGAIWLLLAHMWLIGVFHNVQASALNRQMMQWRERRVAPRGR